MSAAKLAVILAGVSAANRGGPVAVVVISSNGKGDRPVESPEVKAPGGRPEYRSDPYRGASNLAGCSECANSPEIHLPRETDCGIIGSAESVYSRRRPCRYRCSGTDGVRDSPGSQGTACHCGHGWTCSLPRPVVIDTRQPQDGTLSSRLSR